MRPVQFGWVMPVEGADENQVTLLGLQETILPAITRRFDSLWVYDHLYGFSQPTHAYLESWTTLTWLAATYPNIQVGPVVAGVGYRPPALLAKMAATLQTLSEGRFVLGIGAGWREEEYQAYGYPFPTAAVRIRQLEEAVQTIRSMWTETAPSFQGRYFQIENAYCQPHPAPPPPIMIGGEGEQLMLPLVGRQADWWNCGNLPTLEDYRRKVDIVHAAAEKAGRNPDEIVLTIQLSNRPLPETTAESQAWLNFLHPLVGLGFSHFMLDTGPIPSLEGVERFADEVISSLK